MEIPKRVNDFLLASHGGKEDQLAMSQCLDLETTRAWLYGEILDRFYRLEEDDE